MPVPVTTKVPDDVIGLPETANAAGICRSTLVTVPTDQVLFADKSKVTPLIVIVLLSGTGV